MNTLSFHLDLSKILPGADVQDLDRIIEMAWEDRTPFEAIEEQFGLSEKDVISLMRKQLKTGSFNKWRQRTNGRKTKHRKLRSAIITRFKSSRQRVITQNKISKQLL
ncbi:MAG TPA: TIGR03643 family protein [Flavisolibacter sp.]|jgi:uncharacterized protein (TIGR03643 family)|nr:TIGR03643 family protein [Flavisolibacter sp.]